MMRTVLVLSFALLTGGCLEPAAFSLDDAAVAGGDDGGVGANTGSGGDNGGTGSGSGSGSGTGSGGSSASSDGGAEDLAHASMPTDGGASDMKIDCINLTAANGSGHHNAGRACLACHNGTQASLFTAAGTLYNAATNGAAVAGATIELIDANNKSVRIVTSSNGNFYTSTALAFPVTARASGCPNDKRMVSKATGDCNMAGCHVSTFRVHLP